MRGVVKKQNLFFRFITVTLIVAGALFLSALIGNWIVGGDTAPSAPQEKPNDNEIATETSLSTASEQQQDLKSAEFEKAKEALKESSSNITPIETDKREGTSVTVEKKKAKTISSVSETTPTPEPTIPPIATDKEYIKPPKVIKAKVSGHVTIGKEKHVIYKAIAWYDSISRKIRIQIYEGKESLRVATVDFYLDDNKKTCKDFNLINYIIKIYRGSDRSMPYTTIERAGSQIVPNESIEFRCARVQEGWVETFLKGQAASLISGKRVPISWEIDVVQWYQ